MKAGDNLQSPTETGPEWDRKSGSSKTVCGYDASLNQFLPFFVPPHQEGGGHLPNYQQKVTMS